MKTSRRSFLLNAGVAALSTTLIATAQKGFGQIVKIEQGFPLPPETSNDTLNYLRRAHFESLVNTTFKFQNADGRVFNLKLIEVADLSKKENIEQNYTGESYSLLFEGSKKTKLDQSIYQVDHELLGKFSIFIAPVGLRGSRYEAIVNRINIPG